MGAIRPNRAQWVFQAAEATKSWDKHKALTAPKRSGYDPTLRRQTCDHCGNLTWHKNDHCTEC